MTDIRVARFVSPGEPLEVGMANKPEPGPTEVLVRVKACGLVPNVANVTRGLTQFILPTLPAIFGLDASGEIEATGNAVVGLSVGDRVYVDPYLTCETCHACRTGRHELCPNSCLRGYMTWWPDGRKLLDAYPYGGLSEYLISPANKIARLPDTIDFNTAARLGYIGTSFGGLRKGGFAAGQTLAINGVTGTLGVAAVAIALGLGAAKIFGIGRNRDILKRIEQMAPGRIEVMSSEDGDPAAWITERTGGVGVDMLYDCLGAGSDAGGTDAMMRAVRLGGNGVLVAGGVGGEITRQYFEILIHDIPARGSIWFTPKDIDQLIALIGSGVVDLGFLEHREFPLDHVNEAIDLVGARPGGFLNVVVTP